MPSGKAWYAANPEKRNAHRKRNYAQTREGATNAGKHWTTAEIEAILAADRPIDRVLAKRLGRSAQSIQVKRSRCT